MKKVLSFLLCAALIISFCGCAHDEKTAFSFFAMDTLMQVTFYNADAEAAKEFEEIIKEKTAQLDALWGVNSESGDVVSLNCADGAAVTVSDETARITDDAITAFELTDGAFDITVLPVLKLWGFTDGLYGVPESKKIKDALDFTGAQNIRIDGSRITLPEGFGISLGGIAKGFLGDEMIKLAEERGISAVFSLGGNVAVAGTKKDGGKWKIAVADPESPDKTFCTAEVEGGYSVVTSGAYERYFEFEGKKYHHIIDPKTGYPAESDILSVTVIGKDGAMCDAFSTAFFVMGYEKAAELQKTLNGFDYIILTKDGKAHVSRNNLAEPANGAKYEFCIDGVSD